MALKSLSAKVTRFFKLLEGMDEGSRPDPVQPFSLVCREDLDNVRKSRA